MINMFKYSPSNDAASSNESERERAYLAVVVCA